MSEATESWITEYLEPRYPELVAPIREAHCIHDDALKSGNLPESSVLRLVEFARHKRTPLGINASRMLGALADKFPLVRDALGSMARDKKAHVRINALIALDKHRALPLAAEILSAAIRDRSAKIRELAADRIMSYGLRSLLPELEEAIVKEVNSKLRTTMELQRDLLRDGYQIADSGDGRIMITCRRIGGTESISLKKAELQTTGYQWIQKTAVPGTS